MSNLYTKTYTVNDAHIDFQGIMDGLYYPFYLEQCRHEFVKEILEFDMVKAAQEGVLLVLSNYSIKFLRSLGKQDVFEVTCSVHPDEDQKNQVHFKQSIVRNGKKITDAIFTATCVRSGGGRAFLPEELFVKVRSNLPIRNPIF